jgi:hypothetical protein
MAYTDPTLAEFKAYFNRDFPYGNSDLTTVQDADITKALSQQQNTINMCLFGTQNVYTQGALLLAAHYLVQNLRASSQGIAAKFDWPTASKGVGGVSAAFQIPERILENPELAILASTYYGTQYLYLVLPLLTGQMFAVKGDFNQDAQWFGGVYGSIGPWTTGQ